MDIELLLDQFPFKRDMDASKYWKELLKRYSGGDRTIKDIRTPVFEFLTSADYYRSEQGLLQYCADRKIERIATQQSHNINIEDVLKKKRGEKRKLYRILVLSDIHGFFLDLKVRDCILKILKDHDFDEIINNGDCLDMPYISSHSVNIRLNEANIFRDYTETKEIDYTRDQYFKALRDAANKKTLISMRIGNHENRITDPKGLGKEQLLRLQVLQNSFGTIKLDEMLGLKDLNIEYDPTPVRTYFNCFDVVHGLSLSLNAPIMNIREFQSSGTSGHSHRLGSYYVRNRNRNNVWLESGCLRTIDAVEYLPTAKISNWANGFVDVTFDLTEDNPLIFAKTTAIHEGKCSFNGFIY